MNTATATFFLLIIQLGILDSSDAQEKFLRPGDQINLNVGETPPSEETTIIGLFTVSMMGTLRLPHLKEELNVAGVVRPSQLSSVIEEAYRANHVFKNPKATPHISVGVEKGFTNRVVRIAGEVKGTGDIPYRRDLTLTAALAARGGLTESADAQSITILRDGKLTVHNLAKMAKSEKGEFKLKPEDRIFVPRRENPGTSE